MRRTFTQTYMTIGAIFGVILAGPRWFAALFDRPLPQDAEGIQRLLGILLIATFQGVLRAFAWLPSLVYKVVMHHMPIMHWLFTGWW
jgi:hypothetical protein